MGYTPDMDTHTEYTVTQTSVRQSRGDFYYHSWSVNTFTDQL